jgi:hypothetical protein
MGLGEQRFLLRRRGKQWFELVRRAIHKFTELIANIIIHLSY